MSSISSAVYLGVAGGLLVKGVHIAIDESFGVPGIPEVARCFKEDHAGYSTPFKAMSVFEHVILIPLGEEGFFRVLPSIAIPHPLVNYAIAPTAFGLLHYDPKQGRLNTPYVLSQIVSGVIFAALLKTGGFSAAFTAHAVSNLYTVCSLLT